MTRCYYVPGTLSTELYRADNQGGKIWVHPPALVLGEFGCMRLAPDGHQPGPPDGLQLSYGGPLTAYNGVTISTLEDGLGPLGYQIVPWGWDWRMHLVYSGSRLAAQIRSEVTPGDPCTIIGHSAGGLVARWAWTSLVDSGESGLVRRIITLGTPHQGTYYAAAYWCGGQADIQQLVFLAGNLGASVHSFTGGLLGRPWTNAEVIALTMTWPLLYDLLPVLGSPDQSEDPARGKVFVGTQWPAGRRPSQAHLDYSAEVVSPWQLDPRSMPPASVLTTLAGDDYPTPARLADPDGLGSTDAISSTGHGDGVVTTASATVTAAATYVAPWRHIDMPTLAAQSGWLVSAVLDRRDPPTPPPPRRRIAGADYLDLSGPPLPQSLEPAAGVHRCGEVPCRC